MSPHAISRDYLLGKKALVGGYQFILNSGSLFNQTYVSQINFGRRQLCADGLGDINDDRMPLAGEKGSLA